MRVEAEHHGGFPFAGVAHLALLERGLGFPRFAAEGPIRGEKQEEVVALAMALAQFESSLAAGDVVAAVAVDEDEPFETVLEEIFDEAVEEIEIDARGGGECAGKIEVVIGIAEPHERGPEDAVAEAFGAAADDFTEKHT